ncbi:DJ-1/PfpI family protein [Pectobacterium sp. B2J-2]|uniref:DJ-1/PfpI family protein n=1 Tax=Pectobacterium sp. B2J-2 TaxID=3385372 RepID=UPI0038FD2555
MLRKTDRRHSRLNNLRTLVDGHGPMWDFANNPELINIVRTLYENDKIVSAVCHGPAGLLNVKLNNGQLLIKERRLTGFTAE